MHWSHFLLALLASEFIVSMTDWFFMGDIWMRIYRAEPAIWRHSSEGFREGPAIGGSIALSTVTCAGMLLLCHTMHAPNFYILARLTCGLWIITVVPLLFTQTLYMKFHPLLAASHATGWLVKLFVAATAAWFLHV